ncbi:MAG TPA: thioredoxin domain-containing protein [Candidatus Saccharimonadales bacterium]|nr:thioredoxin domain-containing protein [Candidatus Saccharimonadales bacterium]
MDKKFLAILGIIAVIVVGAIWVTNNKKASAPTGNAKPSQHVTGSTSTGVKLVEYGDYQCPYCGQYYPIVKQVVTEYQNQIQFQFRNLPLVSLHPNAFAAARAAEAAGLQNKYWEMHDMLYENQSAWSDSGSPASIFNEYAKALKLNVNKFKTDYSSDLVNNTINADLAEFNKTKAEMATPTFFIDGTKIQPTQSVESFEKIINEAIKQNGHTPQPVKSSPSSTTTPSPSPASNTAPQSKQ